MSFQEAHRLIRSSRRERVSGLTRNLHLTGKVKEKRKDHPDFLGDIGNSLHNSKTINTSVAFNNIRQKIYFRNVPLEDEEYDVTLRISEFCVVFDEIETVYFAFA